LERKKVLTENERDGLKQFLINDNIQKMRDISPSIIAASLCFIIYSAIFNSGYISLSNPYFTVTSIFLLSITAVYMFARYSAKHGTGDLSISLFIITLLVFCSVIGGYVHKSSGN
jgi:hypothetical protein